MGLFSNIWDGIKSAGQWAIEHSADIGSVVKAVAKAAELLIALDNSIPGFTSDAILQSQANETDSQKLYKYPRRFAYVSDQLAATAKAGVKATSQPTGKTTTIDDGLVGLWTDPNGLSFDGKPSTSMYQDLSAFMGTMNIPLSWKDDSGLVHDTVNDIGQILFVNSGPQDLTALAGSDNPIVRINAEAATENGTLHACHVYYPIPMGKAGEDFSLHSAIHLIYTTNADMVTTATAQDHLTVVNPLSDQNSWVVTMNITWASAPIAGSKDVQTAFADIFTKQNSVLSLLVSNVTGTLQTVKVQTPADKTPAYAKAAVQAAVTAAINGGSTNENVPASNTAQVCVTDSSWLPKVSTP
ncbi:hypothetical protein FPRO05_04326 [Fusarium proliferatum]|uniref:Uncharacterized protein n=1 Tax=Gibberella intermedia TaxID=948311 RepID=A0A365MRI2_GIBIN|nr:hypothetical protein FPRO05_04326 [Fusarium proliferatum]